MEVSGYNTQRASLLLVAGFLSGFLHFRIETFKIIFALPAVLSSFLDLCEN